MKRIITIILLTISLQGCFGAFLLGATAGGLIVYDRKNLTESANDQTISHQAKNEIMADKDIAKNTNIDVATNKDVVLLVGQAPNKRLKEKAARIAMSVPNVKRVYNEIRISAPTSYLTRTSDSWITTKVKTKMVATKGLKATNIKVVTEDGTVYLMGEVSNNQAKMAVDVTRLIPGVQKVIKVFEYKNPAAA